MEFQDQNTTDFQYFQKPQQCFFCVNDVGDGRICLGRKIPCVEKIANRISHEIAEKHIIFLRWPLILVIKEAVLKHAYLESG